MTAAFSLAPDRSTKRLKPALGLPRQTLWCYIFLLPAGIILSVFALYPAIDSWVIAFQNWNGFGGERTWVGFANFIEVMGDGYFWAAFARTALYVAVVVPTLLVVSLLLAVTLNDASYRMRPLFRAIFFMPVVATTAIVGVVASLIMNPLDGPLNTALHDIGIIQQPIDFLGDPKIALFSIAGIYVWKWTGISMIYWLVALQTVPKELHEAAQVDGAGTFLRHRYITLPMLLPFAAIIALIAIVGAFQTFPLVQATTRGGPNFATELVELYIYRIAFASSGEPRLGYASAAAAIFGIAVFVITLVQAGAFRALQRARAASER